MLSYFYVNIRLKENPLHTVTLPFQKPKTLSFASSVMKNIVEPSVLSRFLVKLTRCVIFVSTSNFCCLFESIAINL